MRAVVTGGAGFIGSHVVDALLAEGWSVAILDDLSTGRLANLDAALARGARLVEADLRDAPAVEALVGGERPDAIFHLAAQIDVRRSVESPAFDAAVNVEGTVALLEAARRAGVRRFVFSSSGGAIYGEPDALPAGEATAPAPLSPYGQAKHAGEGYCALFRRLHGLSTVSLRYGNVYGPRQDPLGEAGVIAIFCSLARAGRRPTIYGDGRQTRDFVHVDDVVAANLLAARSDAAGAFNVGCGVETSVLELADALGRLAGRPFEPLHEPERPGEVRRIALDATRARAELGWEPRVGLEAGLAGTLAATPEPEPEPGAQAASSSR